MVRCSCLIHSLMITRAEFIPPPLLPIAPLRFRGQSLVPDNGVLVSVYGYVVTVCGCSRRGCVEFSDFMCAIRCVGVVSADIVNMSRL